MLISSFLLKIEFTAKYSIINRILVMSGHHPSACVSVHVFCLLAVLPEALDQLLLIRSEIVRVSLIVPTPDVSVIVIQCFLLYVLILSGEHGVSHVEVFGSLVQSHGFDIPTDLEIKVTHADCALP